ncbi:hypothetical protein ACFL3F_03185, partial [Planctomycetota bacterium]
QTQQGELGIQPGAQIPTHAQASTPPVRAQERLMEEKQLRDLVRTVKERISDYETKLEGLKQEEQRLKTAHAGIQEDLEKLSELRVEVAAAVAELKRQRVAMEQTRIRIEDSEKANLLTTAKTLEQMKDAAAPLIVNICQSPSLDPEAKSGETGTSYAVKLIHLMDQKTRGKLFAALVELEPDLAGALSQKLKLIIDIK